uniref:hypothetical protein n=1 Tax=Flammeovirga sp. OC4 TaxID=1382345 RepID=UPI00155D96E2
YLSTDLTTPLYEIEDGQDGESQNLELEEGTTLVFEAVATEGSTLEWSIDNGEAQTGSTSSFEVLFDTPQEALTSHSLTLSKEGHETVEIEIPLTITVNEEVLDPLTAGIKVYLSTDLTTPLYEIEDGQDGESQNLELEEGTTLVFEAVATEGSMLEWSIDNGETQTGSTSSFEVLFDTPQEALTSHSLTLTKEGHETVEIDLPLTITIKKLVPELLPAFTVMYADQLVYELNEGEDIPENQEEWATVELKEGEALTLTNNTNTELYTDTYWMLDGVEEETLEGKTAEAVFKTEGEYSVHELVIERKDSNYPDLTEKVVIPVKVKVIKAEQPPKPSAIQVFLAEDLETPIYEIEADKVGESKSIAVENGTSLVFKTMASEGVELAWSVNNGAPQTATTASFEVLFEQDNPSLSGHKLTLSKEGFEDVVVQIPLAIEVFTSEELQVAFSIYKNDDLSTPIHTLNVGEEEVSKVIEISEGDRLTFVDQSTGQPTGRTWKINNGVTEVTSSEASFEVMYATTGADLSIALMVERKEHEKYKDASLDYTSKATVDVKQVQNEATVKVGKVIDSGSGVIYFETSHEIASFTSADVLNDFTVGIQNIEANYSNDNATISEVKVAEGNNKRIEIYLVESYFNSDDITVGYAGDKIQSALGVPLSAFTAENVTMDGVVSYMDVQMSGFETAAAEETPNEALGWYVSLKNPKETEKIERVTTTASTGNASMHFAFDLNSSGNRSHKFNTSKLNNSFALEEGEYEMSIDVFIPQGSSTIDIIRTNISTNDDTVDQDVFVNVPWDFSEFPNMKYGEWVTLRQRISLKTIAFGAIKMNFKENDMKLDGLHDFYLDNIQLRKVEARQ